MTAIIIPIRDHITPAANSIIAEQSRAIAKINWNAQAAFKELESGNVGAARRFIRHILATTAGQS